MGHSSISSRASSTGWGTLIPPPQCAVPFSSQSYDKLVGGNLPEPSSWIQLGPISHSHKSGLPASLPCTTFPWPTLSSPPSSAPPTPCPNASAPSSDFGKGIPVAVIECYGGAQIMEGGHLLKGIKVELNFHLCCFKALI